MDHKDVVIVGDGPGGLSAALFLARAGQQVVVYGQDKTAMHAALLNNYLGIEQISGSDFQKIGRTQVQEAGAQVLDARVSDVEKKGDVFVIELESGDVVEASYLILSEGKSPKLAKKIGVEITEHGVRVNEHGATSIENVYAVGRLVRPGRSQAIISAGDGAAAAIDILSRKKREPYVDWDSPE